MATCGKCGGGLLVYSRKAHKRRAFFYACPRSRVRLCTNTLEVAMATADAAAIGMVADDVLSPDVMDLALAKLMAMLDSPAEDPKKQRARLADTLQQTEKKIANITKAIEGGDAPEALVVAMREQERRRRDIKAQMIALDAGPSVRAGLPDIRREALGLLDDWRGLLGRNVATSRQLLRKVLDRERFVFYPKAEAGEKWYEVGVNATLDRFLGSVEGLKKAVASPPGIEPGSRP